MMIRSALSNTYTFSRYLTILFSVPLVLLFSACASTEVQRSYDFGSNNKPPIGGQLATLKISLAEIQVPMNLEGSAMLYRLIYDNPQELRSYANSRWSMPPAQLLKQKIISRINQEGGTVTTGADGTSGLPILRIDLEEFAQHFSTLESSQVQLRWRASLINNKQLLAQKVFSAQSNSGSPDAVGGARAMPQASDQAITELIVWLQTQLK
ncbi:ABC-type transport auxiliary lipoprotein family protein [Undibacterium sp. Di24W]|uniref:ABC-type transport auxiliary lipoprotein family protein n=1 Tax=Undibacterium sp. Di24W TaxID=3413033 RepID=UPI003BF36896